MNNQVWVDGHRVDPEFTDERIRNAVLAERERCAKIADEAAEEIRNAPHELWCKNDWHGRAKTSCTCFKHKTLDRLARIRSRE